MSEPEWLGPATDALKQVGLDEAAAMLAKAPAQADLMERMTLLVETCVEIGMMGQVSSLLLTDLMVLIAEHRGETPEATLARLSPPPIRPAVPWSTNPADAHPVADLRAMQDRMRGFGVQMEPPPHTP